MCDSGTGRVLSENQGFWITCLVVDFTVDVKTCVLPTPTIAAGVQMAAREAANSVHLLFRQSFSL